MGKRMQNGAFCSNVYTRSDNAWSSVSFDLCQNCCRMYAVYMDSCCWTCSLFNIFSGKSVGWFKELQSSFPNKVSINKRDALIRLVVPIIPNG